MGTSAEELSLQRVEEDSQKKRLAESHRRMIVACTVGFLKGPGGLFLRKCWNVDSDCVFRGDCL